MIDLEELTLMCRNETAKENIQEAIKCYRAGAYRSAIISTWLAVFYDVLEKYKELGAIHGHEFDEEGEGENCDDSSINKLARKEYQEYRRLFSQFEANQTKENMSAIIRYETDILEKIHKEFQFISYTELLDLKRLKEDRNRCAHPSFDLNLETYKPSAEISRAHIRSAVEYLLQYPATAGNHVIKIIIDELNSEYAPKVRREFYEYMQGTPISRLKESTIRGLLSAMFDFSLKKEYRHKNKYIYMYDLMRELHPTSFNQYLAKDINTRFRADNVNEETLYGILYWVIWTDVFEYLNSTLKIKIRSYIERFEIKRSYDLFNLDALLASSNIDLCDSAEKRVEILKVSDFNIEESSRTFRGRILDKFISLYVESTDYQTARACANIFRNVSFEWDISKIKYFIYHGTRNKFVKEEGLGFGGSGSFYAAQLYFRNHLNIDAEDLTEWIAKAHQEDDSFLDE